MSFEIFDPTFSNLEKNIFLTEKIQAMHSHNIANASSKNFVPYTFNEKLKEIQRDHSQNSVSLEKEMAGISKNSAHHSAYIKLLSSKISMMKTIVSQGRK